MTEQETLDQRFKFVSQEKTIGATYTPKILADFVAQQISKVIINFPLEQPVRILDPSVGHGELLVSLLEQIAITNKSRVEVYGFDIDARALKIAQNRIKQRFPQVKCHFRSENFLDYVIRKFGFSGEIGLFNDPIETRYDLVIANPPYVRTQIIGPAESKQLATEFGLSGRLDLYYAFVVGISRVLTSQGIAGIIVSNRFMTTKSGASIRQTIADRFNVFHIWDLGDTKIFDAAVLPAVLIVQSKRSKLNIRTDFTSIYQTKKPATQMTTDPIAALGFEGVVEIPDGRRFQIQHGKLASSNVQNNIWRISTDAVETWLKKVDANTWGEFRDVGKIRVGVKTCADKVFIRSDWQDLAVEERPELLKPLTSHHIANRYKPIESEKPIEILYPHEIVQGKRQAVSLSLYPRSKAYLEAHRLVLESRSYVLKSGRRWYEIWVPQNPGLWNLPKLVFRDIAEKPTFWLDFNGTVVNGDCYWLVCQNSAHIDLLWLAAAVGNSTFIENFYDARFNNRLYAGRRRFMTQYVEKFPLPDPKSDIGKLIIAESKSLYHDSHSLRSNLRRKNLDEMVWTSFTKE